jgi:predicted transcriptional regulator
VSTERLAKFVFEVASPERIGILRGLHERPLRHAELAERLSMTESETTRHLARLASLRLIEKDTEGRYRGTPLAEALLVALPLFDFLSRRDEYIVEHDLAALDPTFVVRLGELNDGRLIDGTYPVIAAQEAALRDAHRRIWVVTDHRFEQALPLLRERASHGADVRVVRPRRALEEERSPVSRVERNYPVRLLPEVRIFLAVLDTQAGLSLPARAGVPDLSRMLLLTDTLGYRWAEDLFRSLWNRAEEWRGRRRD